MILNNCQYSSRTGQESQLFPPKATCNERYKSFLQIQKSWNITTTWILLLLIHSFNCIHNLCVNQACLTWLLCWSWRRLTVFKSVNGTSRWNHLQSNLLVTVISEPVEDIQLLLRSSSPAGSSSASPLCRSSLKNQRCRGSCWFLQHESVVKGRDLRRTDIKTIVHGIKQQLLLCCHSACKTQMNFLHPLVLPHRHGASALSPRQGRLLAAPLVPSATSHRLTGSFAGRLLLPPGAECWSTRPLRLPPFALAAAD